MPLRVKREDDDIIYYGAAPPSKSRARLIRSDATQRTRLEEFFSTGHFRSAEEVAALSAEIGLEAAWIQRWLARTRRERGLTRPWGNIKSIIVKREPVDVDALQLPEESLREGHLTKHPPSKRVAKEVEQETLASPLSSSSRLTIKLPPLASLRRAPATVRAQPYPSPVSPPSELRRTHPSRPSPSKPQPTPAVEPPLPSPPSSSNTPPIPIASLPPCASPIEISRFRGTIINLTQTREAGVSTTGTPAPHREAGPLRRPIKFKLVNDPVPITLPVSDVQTIALEPASPALHLDARKRRGRRPRASIVEINKKSGSRIKAELLEDSVVSSTLPPPIPASTSIDINNSALSCIDIDIPERAPSPIPPSTFRGLHPFMFDPSAPLRTINEPNVPPIQFDDENIIRPQALASLYRTNSRTPEDSCISRSSSLHAQATEGQDNNFAMDALFSTEKTTAFINLRPAHWN